MARQKQSITVEPVGGLGNQIFILAAGLEQAQRLGAQLIVDDGWYKSQEKREFQLCQIFPDLILQNAAERSPTAKRWFEFFSKPVSSQIFTEKSSEYDPRIEQVGQNSRLRGYFQSVRYFPTVGKKVVDSILDAPVSDSEKIILDRLQSKPYNAIHVRRGDYVSEKITSEYHGATSRAYFEKAIDFFEDSYKPILVFSDSPDLASEELAGIDGLWFESELSNLGDVATLKLMAGADSLVMSNSSFSWWAAYCIQTTKGSPRIVAPRPWSRDIDLNLDLILPNWFIAQK
jgi:hypothetical protein